ncbi:MAG: Cysteine synthase B [Myxococcota bacterium]|nr:Cysteine synthase B [Myxococcota bacterium]
MTGVSHRTGPRLGWAALDHVTHAVGNTPLIRLRSVEGRSNPRVRIYGKAEWFNPGGSVKDRAALRIFSEAIEDGRLTRDKILIDSTSGNTGVAYSWIGAALGCRVALVMPENVTPARKDVTRGYGAQLIFSSPMEGSDGAIRLVRKLVDENPDQYFYPDQYSNPANPRAHYLTTGVEIWEATEGRITHFVTGLGTTGTVMGTGRRLKEYNPNIKVFGMEPDDAFHGLEGLKHMASSIIPPIYRAEELDGIIAMPTEEGWEMSERLNREGLLVGHSAGANVAAAARLAKEIDEGVIVTILCDRGDRYFEKQKWEKLYEW